MFATFSTCAVPYSKYAARFWVLMKNISIIMHVSICGTYFLYIRIECIHNLFHMTDGRLMCYACVFVRWMSYFFATIILAKHNPNVNFLSIQTFSKYFLQP